MKKIFSILLLVCMVLPLAACEAMNSEVPFGQFPVFPGLPAEPDYPVEEDELFPIVPGEGEEEEEVLAPGVYAKSTLLSENYDKTDIWNDTYIAQNRNANGYMNVNGVSNYLPAGKFTVSAEGAKKGQSINLGYNGSGEMSLTTTNDTWSGDLRISFDVYFDGTAAGSASGSTCVFRIKDATASRGEIATLNFCNGSQIAYYGMKPTGSLGWNYVSSTWKANEWLKITITLDKDQDRGVLSVEKADGTVTYNEFPLEASSDFTKNNGQMLHITGAKFVRFDNLCVESVDIVGVGVKQNVELFSQNFDDTTKFNSSINASLNADAGVTIDGVKYYGVTAKNANVAISSDKFYGENGQSLYLGTVGAGNFNIAPTDKTTLASDNYTVSMWMYLDQTAAKAASSSYNAGTVIYLVPNPSIMVANGGNLRHNNDAAKWEATDIWMPKDEWVLVTIQFDLTKKTISYSYENKDGTKTATSQTYTLEKLDATKPLTNIYFGGGSSFYTYVDDIKIATVYKTTLLEVVSGK